MENYNEENELSDFDNHHNPPQRLGLGQKIAVSFLGFFAMAVIFMWSNQFNNNINAPFTYQGEKTEANSEASTCPDGNCNNELSEEQLKLQDTDQDGLTDWDELNVYNTSPYLEDSDSDGYGDQEEIDKNQDPNCPVGRNCSSYSTDTEIPKTENVIGSSVLDQLNSVSLDNTQATQDNTQATQSSTEIRDLFLQSGYFTAEELANYTDEQLLQSYIEITQNLNE